MLGSYSFMAFLVNVKDNRGGWYAVIRTVNVSA